MAQLCTVAGVIGGPTRLSHDPAHDRPRMPAFNILGRPCPHTAAILVHAAAAYQRVHDPHGAQLLICFLHSNQVVQQLGLFSSSDLSQWRPHGMVPEYTSMYSFAHLCITQIGVQILQNHIYLGLRQWNNNLERNNELKNLKMYKLLQYLFL